MDLQRRLHGVLSFAGAEEINRDSCAEQCTGKANADAPFDGPCNPSGKTQRVWVLPQLWSDNNCRGLALQENGLRMLHVHPRLNRSPHSIASDPNGTLAFFFCLNMCDVGRRTFDRRTQRLDLIGSFWYSSRHYVKDAITENRAQEQPIIPGSCY